MASNNNSLKALPFRLHSKPNTLLPHTTRWLQLVIACLSKIVYSHSAKTLTMTETSNSLGRREVYIGNMDGRCIPFSWEKDLSLELVPSL